MGKALHPPLPATPNNSATFLYIEIICENIFEEEKIDSTALKFLEISASVVQQRLYDCITSPQRKSEERKLGF